MQSNLLVRCRLCLTLVIAGLLLSGLTAFPLQGEVECLAAFLNISPQATPQEFTGLRQWIATVREGVQVTNARFPFLAYGTDWLAFAHLILAVLFVGPWRDPVRNLWVIEFGLLASLGVLPLALVCGPLRGIPFYWQLVDCSFGLLAFIPLWLCRGYALGASAPVSGPGNRQFS